MIDEKVTLIRGSENNEYIVRNDSPSLFLEAVGTIPKLAAAGPGMIWSAPSSASLCHIVMEAHKEPL